MDIIFMKTKNRGAKESHVFKVFRKLSIMSHGKHK